MILTMCQDINHFLVMGPKAVQKNCPKTAFLDTPGQDNPASPFSPKPLEVGVWLNKPISHSDYDKGDESKTDFVYAIALANFL